MATSPKRSPVNQTVKAAFIGGIFAVVAAVIGGLFLLTNNDSDKLNNGISNEVSGNNNQISNTQNTYVAQESPLQDADYISFNYARLFGGYQVPVILAEMAPSGECSQFGPVITYGKDIADYFQNWEYKDAKAIASEPWNELMCGGKRSFLNGENANYTLLVIGSERDPECYKSFKYQADVLYVSESGDYESEDAKHSVSKGSKMTETDFHSGSYMDTRLSDPSENNCYIKNSLNIGFLILFIENQSEKTISDIDLSFKEYIPSTRWNEKSTAENVESALSNLPAITKRIPHIKPHEKLMWLLAIYFKDEKGYPDYYISSTIRPVSISFRPQNRNDRILQEIRLPLMDKAVKYQIPFGWNAQ